MVAETDEDCEGRATVTAPGDTRGAFESVHAQITGILDALRQGRQARADDFVEARCKYQRRSGDVVHLAKSLCNLAQQAAAMGRDDYAERLLQRAVIETPFDGWTWRQLSTAYRRRGKLTEAAMAAERALQFDPTVVARTGRAEVLKAQGRYADALEAYDEATRLFPDNVVARTGRAYVLVLMGRIDEALASLPSGAPLTQQDWVAFHIRGVAHLRAGGLGDAQRLFETGVRECAEAGSRAAFRRALAVTLLRQRRYDEAAEQIDVERLVGDAVLQASSDLLVAHAWGGAGRLERARARFEPVTRLDLPLIARLRDALGQRYRLSSQPPLWPTPVDEDELDRTIEAEEFRLLAVA